MTTAWSLNFYAYQQSLKFVNKFGKTKINEQNKIHKVYLAGALSGVVWGTCCTPIELIRCYSQRYHKKATQSIKHIVDRFGAFNASKLLFRGWVATLYRDIPLCAFYFGQMEMNRKYLPNYGESKLMHFISGSIVGLASWLFIMPMDMVKSNIQTNFVKFVYENNDPKVNYQHMPTSKWSANFKSILNRYNGKILKMWAGSNVIIARVIVCGGINVTYQEFLMRNYLHVEGKD